MAFQISLYIPLDLHSQILETAPENSESPFRRIEITVFRQLLIVKEQQTADIRPVPT